MTASSSTNNTILNTLQTLDTNQTILDHLQSLSKGKAAIFVALEGEAVDIKDGDENITVVRVPVGEATTYSDRYPGTPEHLRGRYNPLQFSLGVQQELCSEGYNSPFFKDRLYGQRAVVSLYKYSCNVSEPYLVAGVSFDDILKNTKNLTPHDCTIVRRDENGSEERVTIQASGEEARAEQIDTPLPRHPFSHVGFRTVRRAYGPVQGLPDFEEGKYYIVSSLAFNAAEKNGRTLEDLIVPDSGSKFGLERGVNGQIVCVGGFLAD